MKITVENTRKIVYLKLAGAEFPARVWQGKSESGIAVLAFHHTHCARNSNS